MRFPILAVGAVAALAIVGGAEAQSVDRIAGHDTEAVTVAIQLEQQVQVAIADARWSDAASMLLAASDLRPPTDPVALSNLSSSGSLYGTIGEFHEAKRIFVKLAQRAAQHGEFATAAHAWIDAAHAAVAVEDPRSSVAYFDRARRYLTSNLLSSEETQTLNDRLAQSSALVARLDR